jgi:hypothetical protein
MKFGFFFVIVFLAPLVWSQSECSQVLLQGFIRDTTSKPGLYNLFIVNKSAGRGLFGKPDGTFSLKVNPNDSVYFRITGYQTLKVQAIPDSSCICQFSAYINPLEYKKNEVVVYPVKSLEELKVEREKLARVETRMVNGFYEAYKSPITALYEEFSRRERMKQKAAELKYQDQKEKVVQELLRVYVSYDVIELEEEEFEEFLVFLNLNEEFLKSATDYELVMFIKEKYIHFRQMKGNYIYDPNQVEQIENSESESPSEDQNNQEVPETNLEQNKEKPKE